MISSISRQYAKKQIIMKDLSSNAIQFDMSKCIGCQSCVRMCKNVAGQNILKAVTQGGKKIIQTSIGLPLSSTKCIGCGQYTLGCPTGALVEKDAIAPVSSVLRNKNGKICVAQIAPAVRVNMAEALGVKPGTVTTGKLVHALRLLGFDYVFDTNFAADMTIVEEATELLQRLSDPKATLPMFTSCCPAWVNYVEKSAPEIIPHLSTCRSPAGMLSAVIKNVFSARIGKEAKDIVSVSVMPCTAKKDESKRPQLRTKDGIQETDFVITSRELAKMIKKAGIKYNELTDSECDNIYSEATGGGAIFCNTGGVMEAAVRSAYKFVEHKDLAPIDLTAVRGTKDGIKTAEVTIGGTKVGIAVAHGIKNAMNMIKKIKAGEEGFKDIKFCEVMACPGGCVCGGGSPKAKTKKVQQQRLDAVYKIDKTSKARTPQDNEQLNQLYKESLGGHYGSHIAHELLHTHFTTNSK
jgi:NADH-quinone oxidoreductase subunit G